MAADEARRLRPDETALIEAMLASKREAQSLRQELATDLVKEMNDGHMGSPRFIDLPEESSASRLPRQSFRMKTAWS